MRKSTQRLLDSGILEEKGLTFIREDSPRYVVLKDTYGVVRSNVRHLLNGATPTILTALDKTSYTVNRFMEVWGTRYDYSKFVYIGAQTKGEIICEKHGSFLMSPSDHLWNHGCPKCKNEETGNNSRLTTSEFIVRAQRVHGTKYTYDNTVYVDNRTKLEITCPLHGSFWQTAAGHLQGANCRKCAQDYVGWTCTKWKTQAKHSKNFDNFKVYIIECWNATERFYKIGRTFMPIGRRFANQQQMPYKWKLLKTFIGDADYIFDLENELQAQHKAHRYVPTIFFKGNTECFSKINKEAYESDNQ